MEKDVLLNQWIKNSLELDDFTNKIYELFGCGVPDVICDGYQLYIDILYMLLDDDFIIKGVCDMEKQKILVLLKEWQEQFEKLDAFSNKVYEIFDGGLPDAVWETFSLYSDTLSKLLGDDTEDTWLDWYCYENDMGKKGYDAGYDGELKPITTLEDLADLIIEGRNRT